MDIYKIECFTTSGVRDVKDAIICGGGHCVVEGLAIVTDYSFCEKESNDLFWKIANTHSDLTPTDFHVFFQSFPC